MNNKKAEEVHCYYLELMSQTADRLSKAKERQGMRHQRRLLVAMRLGDTPVPIPNTTVKAQTADDTILVTVWQNRWLPDNILKVLRLLKEKTTE